MTKNDSLKSFKSFLLLKETEIKAKESLENAKESLENAKNDNDKKQALENISKALKEIDPNSLDADKKEAYFDLVDKLKANSSVVTEAEENVEQEIIDLCNIILGIKNDTNNPDNDLEALNKFAERANITQNLLDTISNSVSHFDGSVLSQITDSGKLLHCLKTGKISKEAVALIISLRRFANEHESLFTKSGTIVEITFKNKHSDKVKNNPLINTLYEPKDENHLKLKEKYKPINDLFVKIKELKLSKPMEDLFDSANNTSIETLISTLDKFANNYKDTEASKTPTDEKKDGEPEKENGLPKSDEEYEQEIATSYANMAYGYKTPVVYDFPRDESYEKSRDKINNYFARIEQEMLKHLENMSGDSKDKIRKNSRVLNPDKYWNECIKKAGLYNNTLNEGVGRLVFDSAKRGLRNAGKSISNFADHITTDTSSAIKNGIRNVKDVKSETSHYKGAGKDYDYAGDNKAKGEVRADETYDTFVTSCSHIIDEQKRKCLEFLKRSRERISIDKYYKYINSIATTMQETKSKLKDKENAFKKVVNKGTLSKRIQDATINRLTEKDPNKIAYDKEQKNEDIKEAVAIFNRTETNNTQRIAKWMLADLLINNSDLTPEQFLKLLETKFTKIHLKGSLHGGMIYEIDESKIKNIIVKNNDKYQIVDFGVLQPTAKYETPISLFREAINEFKDVEVGNLDLVKNMKTALKNDTFAKNIEPFKKEMEKYFAARNSIRGFINENKLHLPKTSINTEQYVRSLAESLFGGNGTINMIWEVDEQSQQSTPIVNQQQTQPAGTKYDIFAKYKCVTNDNLQKLFGNGSGKINFLEHGPEDLAAIQQFAYSSAAMLIDKAENKYYFFERNNIDSLFNELTQDKEDTETSDNKPKTTGQGLLKRAPQVLAAHEYGQSAENGTRGANDPNQDESGFSVTTEPKATVTTGAVGDVTIPQRLPNATDVMKRKLNYTTYTYKNGPITVQKRKYDD